MADPFVLLVDALIHQSPVTLLDAIGNVVTVKEGNIGAAEYISFGPSYCFLLACPVPLACRNVAGSQGHYTMGAVYFLHLRQHLPFSEYLRECRAINWPHISIIDRKLVLQALSGATEHLVLIEQMMTLTTVQMIKPRSIDEIKGLQDQFLLSETAIPSDIRMDEQNPSGVAPLEKPAFIPGALFLSRNKNYSGVVSTLRALLKVGASSNAPQQVRSQGVSSRPQVSTSPSSSSSSLLPMGLSVVNPRQLLDQMKGGSGKSQIVMPAPAPVGEKSRNDPIIVVPFSSTSTINMFNVKQFLEECRFVDPTTARAECCGKKPAFTTVSRERGKNDILSYLVIDSASRLSLEDWKKRVVAVFAQGAAWQFKDWPEPYDSPTQLFSLIQGFHLKHEDEMVDPRIKGWNVQVLNVHQTRPHLDLESVFAFWSTLDASLHARGLIHSATGGLGTTK
ncbi:hypothetical protein DI09_16p330 [Mitosporidium daphniae]|uniref:Cell division control protein 73 C-terminal domain-containing protein n=1 Tax=Mitosporidium daphniae TaxID=1485682 RepID=A0A098VUH2_9MICR|nr:uncharacterized protein DI09_16p330 [Mitosporidium daphniae]KGG52479.1 hypothetical protein DI09_16p330 [Mitosporidium daphniae]|eukprot:XP_013238906.1 uncharacterized protein DI09_16p330 [Mitosporidium daphniae]